LDGGCGLVRSLESPDLEIQAAVRSLLADDSYRRAAERFGTTLRRLGSGRRAVDRLEQLLAARISAEKLL